MSPHIDDGRARTPLFQAYRKLDTFDDERPLAPWLFRIAHNRCIDFLRRRGVRQDAEVVAMEPDAVLPSDPPGPDLGRAVERLVLTLPPKERACVLLKDVFDFEEIADLVDSTVGGVKAALNRGRSKLAPRPEPPPAPAATAEMSHLLDLYEQRFNARDWDGLRELISADARLQVADRFSGRLIDSPYFSRYEGRTVVWRMAVGRLDGELAVITLHRDGAGWTPRSIVRLDVADGQVVGVSDYTHCPWMIPAAGWAQYFGQDSEPVDDARAYPPFVEVREKYVQLRARNLQLLESMSEEDLDKPSKAPPKGREHEFATFGRSFLALALHQMIHRSHVTDARRAARVAA